MALNCLPETLEETYETILLEISREDWQTARSALCWISGHSDLQFSYGIPAKCLSTAVLITDNDTGLEIGEHEHHHEFLKAVLGCLIEVSFVEGNDEGSSTGMSNRSRQGDRPQLCTRSVVQREKYV